MKSIPMKSILMTKAILDGRKVQSRRVVKTEEGDHAIVSGINKKNGKFCLFIKRHKKHWLDSESPCHNFYYSKYQKDEVIWVRESVKISGFEISEQKFDIKYMADNKLVSFFLPHKHIDKSWTKKRGKVPGGCIKEMARIFLEVASVRVEKLQDISITDIKNEGCPEKFWNGRTGTKEQVVKWWIDTWNKTAPKGYKWEDNPYVFVYEFKRVEKHYE